MIRGTKSEEERPKLSSLTGKGLSDSTMLNFGAELEDSNMLANEWLDKSKTGISSKRLDEFIFKWFGANWKIQLH